MSLDMQTLKMAKMGISEVISWDIYALEGSGSGYTEMPM